MTVVIDCFPESVEAYGRDYVIVAIDVIRATTTAVTAVDGNANTRLFAWEPGVAHRLRVHRSPTGYGWRASVDEVVVRDLFAGGEHVTGLMVWSEVFAACDDPSVVVRWSRFAAVDEAGTAVVPSAVAVTYQAFGDGGCTNTDVSADDVGVRQVTGVPRRAPHGTVFQLPG